MSSPNISQLITTTLQQLNPEIADAVINNNAILKAIGSEPVSGGRYLSHPMFYAENESFQWYSGWDLLSTQTNEIITSAEFLWKFCTINVKMSGEEEIMNDSDEALIKLIKAKIVNSEATMKNRLAQALYSDGTGSGGLEVGGLQLLVADTPSTGTVGGINAANWEFWRNVSYSSATDGGAAATSSNIVGYMDATYRQVTNAEAGQSPDLIIGDDNYYGLYEAALDARQRIVSGKGGTLGPELTYKGKPYYLDGGMEGNCPENHCYMLNTQHLKLQYSRKRNMSAVGGERLPINQDGSINYKFWAGNLTCGNRRYQAVLKA